MSITDDTLAVARELRRSIGTMIDAEQRTLVAAWARAWDTVAEQWVRATDEIAMVIATGGTPTHAQILNLQRAQNALAATIDQIDGLATDMGIRLTPISADIVAATAQAEARMIATQYPGQARITAASFDMVNPQALDAIVTRTTSRITAASYELAPAAYQSMMVELTRAVPAGLSPRDAAARMLRGVETQFNGGLPRALTIARTEILDASRLAAYQQQAANADVLAGWVWSAHLDTGTCPACIVMHGTVHPTTEQGPIGHPNCRCARMPKTQSWADLGFPDLDEPADQTITGEEWFRSLSRAEQVGLMGPARMDALDAGVPFTDLAMVRHNPGWRDSIQPTPARDLIAA